MKMLTPGKGEQIKMIETLSDSNRKVSVLNTRALLKEKMSENRKFKVKNSK